MSANSSNIPKKRKRGFTLVELQVTLAIFSLLMGAIISIHLAGVRLHQFVKPKLSAADEARKAVSLIIEEVRCARKLRVGTGDSATFVEVPVDTPQQGTALQIYPGTNEFVYVRYYKDTNENSLKRAMFDESGLAEEMVIANCITNEVLFSSEDFTGAILTNNANNHVIGMSLQFYQIQYPITQIGEGKFYDFYQLRTKVARRAIL